MRVESICGVYRAGGGESCVRSVIVWLESNLDHEIIL